ncbi:MAG: phosphate transport system substrate-binding protein [Thermodesulfobacteriota bacterium]|nr:phosphate transport system substrate-binding protein [Thermodesulfobacteriota bacterium]
MAYVKRFGCFTFVLSLIAFCASVTYGNELDRFKDLEGTLDIAGGTAHIPVMKDAAQKIMTLNSKIKITIAAGGSGVGVQKVAQGLVGIGNTGRALSQAEIEKFGLKSFPFAIDGVAVAVHPGNQISNVTSDQVRDIFSGKITNWKEVGGKDAKINLYSRDEASGTREVFWDLLLKKGPVAQSANVVPSNGAMKVALGKDPNAIGYVGIGHIDNTIKAVTLDGIIPSQEHAADGSYKVTRKLYMNTKGEPVGLAKVFIEYIQGPEGSIFVKKSGYIPLQ